MNEWADYSISAVRYNKTRTLIQLAKVSRTRGGGPGKAEVWPRIQVVAMSREGKTFVTTFSSAEGRLQPGPSVHVLRVNGKLVIRTDENAIEADDLANLPEF